MNSTITGPITLGRISANRMYGVRSLRSRAAATYSSSRSLSTAARTVRAMTGANTKPTTTMMVRFDGPSEVMASTATRMTGSARTVSMSRLRMSSTAPRK